MIARDGSRWLRRALVLTLLMIARRAYAAEVKVFASLVRAIWPPPHTPLLLAPDMNVMDERWIKDFLAALFPPAPPAPPPAPSGGDGDGDGGTGGEEDGDEDVGAARGHRRRHRRSPPPPHPPPPAPLQPLDYLTHHMYPLGAGDDPELRTKMMDPKRLDQSIGERLRLASRLVTNRTRGLAKVCVSETGGAYNSGQRGATDSFGSSFWWLDLLGGLGRSAHDFACRQTLVGGRYALVDLARRQPNPDFWATLLYRRLFSPKALRAVRLAPRGGAAGANASTAKAASGNWLRSYAACARAGKDSSSSSSSSSTRDGTVSDGRYGDDTLNVNGGAVILLANFASETTSVTTIDLGGLREACEHRVCEDPDGVQIARIDYLLTSGEVVAGTRSPSLASRTVKLNGQLLRAGADGTIPPLEGEPTVGRVVRLPPLSYGFFVFPEARNSVCFTPRQLAEQRHEQKAAAARGSKRSTGRKQRHESHG